VSSNLFDDDTGSTRWRTLAGFSSGWQGLYRLANIKTGEGNSPFSGS
jgi:hypothetical protein